MSSVHPKPPRVVLADDDDGHREMLATALRSRGFDVTETRDGAELLSMLLLVPESHFTAVVTDQFMPGLKGTEVLARASARAAFFIVTGHRDEAVLRAAEQFGAAAVLRKPVDVSHLSSIIGVESKRRSGTMPVAIPIPQRGDDDEGEADGSGA